MNALWLTRICAYKNTTLSLTTARTIIEVKIDRRIKLLRKFKTEHIIISSNETNNIKDILLFEAREAKTYWKKFMRLLPQWVDFSGRQPRRTDITNRLLDIGYHHIGGKVNKILTAHDIAPAMALLHIAKRSDSQPLVYDLMEMFRADLVEAEVLHFLRLKKRPVEELRQKDIACFLRGINKRMNHKYFLRDFKQCHTYSYYMELQILKFIRAVNHQEYFRPIKLPVRNENRCS